MIMAADTKVYELAGGEIFVWQEDSGVIMLKIEQKYNDPVELGAEEALELADLLTRLVKSAQ